MNLIDYLKKEKRNIILDYIHWELDLIKEISTTVTNPVVALGGAGNLEHMIEALKKGFASALAAGSFFVFQGPKKGVLINYVENSDLHLFR